MHSRTNKNNIYNIFFENNSTFTWYSNKKTFKLSIHNWHLHKMAAFAGSLNNRDYFNCVFGIFQSLSMNKRHGEGHCVAEYGIFQWISDMMEVNMSPNMGCV